MTKMPSWLNIHTYTLTRVNKSFHAQLISNKFQIIIHQIKCQIINPIYISGPNPVRPKIPGCDYTALTCQNTPEKTTQAYYIII